MLVSLSSPQTHSLNLIEDKSIALVSYSVEEYSPNEP